MLAGRPTPAHHAIGWFLPHPVEGPTHTSFGGGAAGRHPLPWFNRSAHPLRAAMGPMTACGEVGRLAQYLLARLGRGVEPDAIASLVSPDVRFEIAGDVGVFPWIGTRIGRRAASDFIRDRRREVEQLRIDVHDVLVSDRRAVILG